MQIENVAITSLVEDPSNARKHDPKNLDAIKGSLAKFGQQKPIVVGKGNVVLAGNGTLSAAKALGWDKINIVRTELEGSEAIAYAIADNRTGELAAWNDDVLSRTLQGLKDDGIDLGAIGFDDDDLAQWLKTPEVVPGCDEDEVPEVTETRCKPGDLWQLGNHRLLCGDSTSLEHVTKLFTVGTHAEQIELCFTSPPYADHMFPVALPEAYIRACTSSNGTVYEPFSGSGSTLIACEKTNRRCFGMEIDPGYCDVILARWEKFTGKQATLVTGEKQGG